MRLDFIDRFRGISIIFMILGHTSLYWLRFEDKWLFGYIIIFGDFIGASAFIMISGTAFSLSYYAEQRKLDKDPSYTKREARLTLFTRNILLLGIAILFNGIGTAAAMNGPIWWAWFVLQTIAVARCLLYPCIRLKKWIKFLLAIVFFSVADPFRRYLEGQSFHVFTAFFSVPEQNTPFPFWGFFLFGMIIGDYINSRITDPDYTIEKQYKTAAQMIVGGIIFIILSLILWVSLYFHEILEFPMWVTTFPEPLYNIQVPALFYKGSVIWCASSFGIHLILMGVLYRYDIKKENDRSSDESNKKIHPLDREKSGLLMLGQYSLTIYCTHYIIFYLMRDALTYWEYLIIFPIMFFVLYSLYWLWINPGKTWITVEWMLKILTMIVVYFGKPKEQRDIERLKMKLLTFLFEKYRMPKPQAVTIQSKPN